MADALRLLNRHYPESRFGGFSDIDGTVAFYTRVRALLQPDFRVLDIGCGRGAGQADPVPYRRDLRRLRGVAAQVVGIDVDPDAASNPLVDEFRLVEPDAGWPIDDSSVDLSVADWVIEHVHDPPSFMSECARVTRPGGYVCIRTTNLASYAGAVSRLVPPRLHARMLRRAGAGRDDADIFPTFYRCNTRPCLERTLTEAGFHAVAFGYNPEPTYLAFSPIAYRVGTWYQRLAPRSIAITLFAFGSRH